MHVCLCTCARMPEHTCDPSKSTNTGGPVCVCPMQTFCECVPGSSQLKHRWSDSESAREAPAKVRPRRHPQMKHSQDIFLFFFKWKSHPLAVFFISIHFLGASRCANTGAYCILNVTFCHRAAVKARPRLSCLRGN